MRALDVSEWERCALEVHVPPELSNCILCLFLQIWDVCFLLLGRLNPFFPCSDQSTARGPRVTEVTSVGNL